MKRTDQKHAAGFENSALWLGRFSEAEVEIHYLAQTAYKDRGLLIDSGDNWVELLKDNGETLLIPISAIRVMKVIERARSDRNTLLRPADNEKSEPMAQAVAGSLES